MSSNFADRYSELMAEAGDTYADVIKALALVEVPAYMTQTGGMCLAIEIKFGPGESHFWLTDREDSLSWERAESDGWALGYYFDPCNGDDDYWNESRFMLEREHKTVEMAVDIVLDGIRVANRNLPRQENP